MKPFHKTLHWQQTREDRLTRRLAKDKWQTQLGSIVHTWASNGLDETDLNCFYQALQNGAYLYAGYGKNLFQIALRENRADLFNFVHQCLSFEKNWQWREEETLKEVLEQYPQGISWLLMQKTDFNRYEKMIAHWVYADKIEHLELLQQAHLISAPLVDWSPYLLDCTTFKTAQLLFSWGAKLNQVDQTPYTGILDRWVRRHISKDTISYEGMALTELYIQQGGNLNQPIPILDILTGYQKPLHDIVPWLEMVKDGGGRFEKIPSHPHHLVELLDAGYEIDFRRRGDFLEHWLNQEKRHDSILFFPALKVLQQRGMDLNVSLSEDQPLNAVEFFLQQEHSDKWSRALKLMKLGIPGPAWHEVQGKMSPSYAATLESAWLKANALEVNCELQQSTPAASSGLKSRRM